MTARIISITHRSVPSIPTSHIERAMGDNLKIVDPREVVEELEPWLRGECFREDHWAMPSARAGGASPLSRVSPSQPKALIAIAGGIWDAIKSYVSDGRFLVGTYCGFMVGILTIATLCTVALASREGWQTALAFWIGQ